MRALRKAVVVAVALTLATAACGDDDESATTSTTEAPTTTADDTTSTTAAEGTTTTAAESELGDQPTFRDDGPSGSGCEPGEDELPDGWWYGDLIVPPGVGLSFDLACYYTGAAAEAEAASRGDEVTNDYYVVDDNDLERMLAIAEGATASCVDPAAQIQLVDCTPPDVAGDWNVWVRVVDGAVDRMIEQYAP
jgi:hypothetical protein